MAARIRVTSPVQKRIQVTSQRLPKVDGSVVVQALGAEALAARITPKMGPISLVTLRTELFNRLQSTGGRPALAGTSKRVKIPLGDQEWAELEQLAAELSTEGYTPSAGQVASTLLSLSMSGVRKQLENAS